MIDLFNRLSNLITDYIIDPVAEAYTGSIFESAYTGISKVLDTELYRAAGDELSAGRPVTIGSLAKDFTGGFLGSVLDQGRGGARTYKQVQMPKPTKISRPSSTAGTSQFRSTPVDLAANFGFTNSVKQNLVKAAYSDVPNVRSLVDTILKSANRKVGVRTRLGSQTVGTIKTKTSLPRKVSPKYFT
mgnify:FL=1